MTSHIDHERLTQLFLEARTLPPESRDAFLDIHCADAPNLKQRLQSMLAHDATPDSGLDAPLFGSAVVLRAALAEAETDALPLTPSPRIAGFTIEGVLGAGGMGVVYRALQDQPRRLVALKVIRSGVASKAHLRRFDREARILALLRHPGIAQIYGAGTTDDLDGSPGQPWFAMELIDGLPLINHADEQSLDRRARLELFARVCDAVAHAHAQGVVHRDLKPANILIDQNGQPKIVDFGVAMVSGADIHTTVRTAAGQLIGTVAYMSPEQARGGGDIDARADIYSLGVILYELLTGRLPYDLRGRNLIEAVNIVVEEIAAPLSSINRTLAGDLQTIVSKTLEKEPVRRYQSVADLADDIRRYVRNEPIRARPAGALYQLRKFARRHRALVGAAMFAAAALLIGSAVALRQAVVATQARHEAQRQTEITRAVNAFLNDVLGAADPWAANLAQRPEEVTILQALERASGRARVAFNNEPEIEAAILTTLGSTYRNLGQHDEASVAYDRALALRESALGPDHSDTLEARRHVAIMRNLRGEYDEAAEAFRAILPDHERVLGPHHVDTFFVRRLLGQSLSHLGELDEAESVIAPALAAAKATLGDSHAATRALTEELARLRAAQNRFVESAELHQQLVDAFRAADAMDDPAAIAALQGLANALTGAGEFDRAFEAGAAAMKASQSSFGDQHPQTIISALVLSRIAMRRNDLVEAERLARFALTGYQATVRPTHAALLTAQFELGVILLRAEQLDEARELITSAAEARLAELGEAHPDTRRALAWAAEAARCAGDFTAAAALHERRLDIEHRHLGVADPATQRSFQALMVALADTDQPDHAYSLADQFISEARGVGGERLASWYRRAYAGYLHRAQRSNEAEVVLLEDHRLVSAEFGPDSEPARITAAALASLYEQLQRPEDAARWRAAEP